jgi:hypothetical protein
LGSVGLRFNPAWPKWRGRGGQTARVGRDKAEEGERDKGWDTRTGRKRWSSAWLMGRGRWQTMETRQGLPDRRLSGQSGRRNARGLRPEAGGQTVEVEDEKVERPEARSQIE